MAVVDLVGVVGDVTEAENAVITSEGRDRASDRKVGLSNHIHSGPVRDDAKLVVEVGLGQVLNGSAADEGVEMAGLAVGPVVQVLLEVERDYGASNVLGSRILDRGVSALVDGEGAVARGITCRLHSLCQCSVELQVAMWKRYVPGVVMLKAPR